MRYRNIAFFGDSFTWGEGLELYLSNQKWVKQRKFKSNWGELLPIQDNESILFRETHRFPKLVTSHFNSNLLIDNRNGGSFRSLIENLKQVNDDSAKPDVIIYQFSAFSRNDICFESDSTNFNCKCNLCKVSNKFDSGWSITFDIIYQIISEHTYNNLSEYHESIKKEFSTEYGINFDSDIDQLVDSIKLVEFLKTPIHLKYLIDFYFKKLESDGIPVFFIDSWDSIASKFLFENQYFLNKLIPLIGYDDKLYSKYLEWETTFPHKRIVNEFPKTENQHPTLLQHQYIGKSVIQFLEKKELKKQIKYI